MEISWNLIGNTLERDIHAFTIPLYIKEGEVPEWSNGAVSKTVVLSRVPRVRIPVSPPYLQGKPVIAV